MNYYPFHIGDYLSATRHLSWEEDAAYRRLLDTYYTTEKPIPADMRAACRLVLAQTDGQREAVRVVLEEFFVPTADGWVNSRADDEIANMRARQEKQRDKANKRWHKPREERGNAPAMPQHTEIDAAASKTDADAMPPVPVPVPVKTKVKDKTPVAAAPLPDWLPPDVWESWRAERRERKKTMTTRAENEAIGALSELRARGHDPVAVIRQSIANGWSGLFEVKANTSQAPPNGKTAKQREAEAFMRSIGGGSDGNGGNGNTIDGTAERVADHGDRAIVPAVHDGLRER